MFRASILALASLALSGTAAAASTDVYNQRGAHANATVTLDNGDGCSYTIFTIWYGEGLAVASGSGATSTTSVYAWYDTYDLCDGSFAWTQGSATSASYSAGGTSASISGSIDFVDWFTGDPVTTVAFDLSLASSTGPTRGMSMYAYAYPGGMFRSRSVGTTYYGDATGTIGGVAGTGSASWGSSTSGSVTRTSY